MSKAFDKIWLEEFIYNLNSVVVSDLLLKLVQSFLTNTFQRVLLNGQTLEWLLGKASVPQGSALGPLFSLMYMISQRT